MKTIQWTVFYLPSKLPTVSPLYNLVVVLSQDFHKKCRAVQYADERNRSQKSRNRELLIGRAAGFLKADWPSRLSPVFAENRMWKFQRKKRNSALTSGKHLSVICVTQGGGRSEFQCALQRVGTRPRNDWHWPFMNKSSVWGKALRRWITVLRASPGEC